MQQVIFSRQSRKSLGLVMGLANPEYGNNAPFGLESNDNWQLWRAAEVFSIHILQTPRVTGPKPFKTALAG
jgi:hypothetical protein